MTISAIQRPARRPKSGASNATLATRSSFPIIGNMGPEEINQDVIQPAEPRAYYVLGTAGHIDHGKTSLIRAITGIDTDRLPEEKRRGMTIELGFAELQLGGFSYGIVDVPGHERFVKTMVAGATGINLALIVVAADDSVMPQTIEHVDILHLLRVDRAVVAVTKIDMVEREMVDMVIEEVGELLENTPLSDSPICPVSSVTGQGIEELKKAIIDSSTDLGAGSPASPFRMCVDRVFSVQGRGTVVTGSVQRGTVQSGDQLQHFPGGDKCRVRDLQAHGRGQNALQSGQRAAVNLIGIDKDLINRGSELVTPGYLEPTHMIDVKLECLPTLSKAVKKSSSVRLELGTMEVLARVVLLDRDKIEPGDSVYAQLRVGEPITVFYGQRFIIREETASRTIGGGVVLRPVSRRRRRSIEEELESLKVLESGSAEDRIEEVLRFAGFSQLDALQLCCRSAVELDQIDEILDNLKKSKRRIQIAGSDLHITPGAKDDLVRRLTRWLERFHRSNPELPGRNVDSVLGWLERLTDRGIAKPLFEDIVKSKKVKLIGRFACLPAFAPELTNADEKILRAMVEELRAAGLQPPALTSLSSKGQADKKRIERLATLAVAFGELVKVDSSIYLHSEIESSFRDSVAKMIEDKGGVTLSEVREAVGSTRKYMVPIMEHLDRVGFTKRDGDKRVLASPKTKRESED